MPTITVLIISRFVGAFGLVSRRGRDSTRRSKTPPALRNALMSALCALVESGAVSFQRQSNSSPRASIVRAWR